MEYNKHKPSPLRPNSAESWQKRGDHAEDIGHVFKHPYSYYDILRHVDDPALKKEWNAKAWRLFWPSSAASQAAYRPVSDTPPSRPP